MNHLSTPLQRCICRHVTETCFHSPWSHWSAMTKGVLRESWNVHQNHYSQPVFSTSTRHLRWEAFRDNARPASRIFTAKWARSSVKRGHTAETTLRNLTTVAAPTQREQLRARDGCLFHYLLLASSNKQRNAAHRIGMGLWPHRHRKFHDQSTRHSPHRKRRGH